MNGETVIEILKLLEENGIETIVDGGWGVDALLGEQTRLHDDLDIAILHKDVSKLRKILAEKGYTEILRDDSRECNFVLEDESKNQIDVHSYTFNEHGNNVFGVAYLPEDLTGEGKIKDYPVKCVAPESAIKFHTGYPLDENDFHDVRALCEKFGFQIPPDYEKFLS